jgi:hypothetical protein
MRAILLAGLLAGLPAIGGCDASTTGGSGTSSDGRPASAADNDQIAKAALATWEPVVAAHGTKPFLLRTDPTTVIGDVDAGFKEAWLTGKIQSSIALPTTAPADATLTWPGRGTTSTHVLSAADALKALQVPMSSVCSGCAVPTPLEITSAAPGTIHVASSLGPVEVPTWVFTFSGHSSKIIRLAVPTDSPLFASDGPQGQPGDAQQQANVTVGADGRSLTVTQIVLPSTGPCLTSLTAHVFESAHVVSFVTIETQRTAASGPSSTCVPGPTITATMTLTAPLGSRTVLDFGMPITVSR